MLEEIDLKPLAAVTGGNVSFKDDDSRKAFMDALQSLMKAVVEMQSSSNDWFAKFLPILIDIRKGKTDDDKKDDKDKKGKKD